MVPLCSNNHENNNRKHDLSQQRDQRNDKLTITFLWNLYICSFLRRQSLQLYIATAQCLLYSRWFMRSKTPATLARSHVLVPVVRFGVFPWVCRTWFRGLMRVTMTSAHGRHDKTFRNVQARTHCKKMTSNKRRQLLY